jgi:predicted ATPase/class 3 adenylate cyclase
VRAPTANPNCLVTYLFTDVAGSTRLWEEAPQAMSEALARHDQLIETLVAEHGGALVRPRGEGDSRFAVFARAIDAAVAACAIQLALEDEAWRTPTRVRVRMALHTGQAEFRAGDYYGTAVNRAARLRAIASAGQTLLSAATAELVRDALPAGMTLRGLGTHRLKDLSEPEQVFQLLHPRLPADFPPLRSLSTVLNNLPAQTTSMVGREQELAALHEQLLRPEIRLVTIFGPGGVGKTRLALQVAADVLDAFDDGVFFVNLAPIRNPQLVAATIAQALDARETGGSTVLDTLREALRGRSLLIIVDNFEQVLQAGVDIASLLAGCPHLKILVTSRSVLNISGEHAFELNALTVPESDVYESPDEVASVEAVQLFVDRARAVKRDFELDQHNAAAVAGICRRVDGLPLALELAAARVRVLPPRQLLARLDRRLPVLVGGARDRPTRQQTLRETIAWSYELLKGPEQRLFRCCSAFVGGVTLAALETVGSEPDTAVLELADALVTHSVMHLDSATSDEPRFRMLETIREFGFEELMANGELADTRQRQLALYLPLLKEAAVGLTGSEQATWLTRLVSEQDNLRALLAWALDRGEFETLLEMCAALWRVWEMRGGLSEGRGWLERALASNSGPAAARAEALTGAGTLAWHQGDYQHATACHTEALALCEELGNEEGVAFSLNNLGAQALQQGDYAQAQELFEACRARAESANIPSVLGYVYHNLGEIARHREQLELAELLYERALHLFQDLGNRWAVAHQLLALGVLAHKQGEPERALAFFRRCLGVQQELGDQDMVADCLEGVMAVAARQGNARRAAVLGAAAANLRQVLGVPVPPVERDANEAIVSELRAQLGEESYAAAYAAGAALPFEQAVRLALELSRPA